MSYLNVVFPMYGVTHILSTKPKFLHKILTSV